MKIVNVGTGGFKNLEAHRTSKACQSRTKANLWNRASKPNQSLDVFFKPRVPLNPSTVSTPPPIHPAVVGAKGSVSEPCANPIALAEPLRLSAQQGMPTTTDQTRDRARDQVSTHGPQQGNPKAKAPPPKAACPKAIQLLQDLEVAMEQVPSETPSATQAHRLSIFAVDPCTCVAEPGEDDWPILNGMLKGAFGWGEIEMAAAIPEMLNRGEWGLDGFVRFLRFFVFERGLKGALFETKAEALVKELGNR